MSIFDKNSEKSVDIWDFYEKRDSSNFISGNRNYSAICGTSTHLKYKIKKLPSCYEYDLLLKKAKENKYTTCLLGV